jgi:hypothetical protein
VGRGIGPREKLLISICSGDGLVVRRFGASGCALVAGGYEVMCSSSCGKLCVSGGNSHVGFHVAWCNVVYVAMVTASKSARVMRMQ